MIAKPELSEPPIKVLEDMAALAVADYFHTPPNKLEKTFTLGGEGIDYVARKFHERFHTLFFGFDEGILWWYLTGTSSVKEIAVAVHGYIQELLRT